MDKVKQVILIRRDLHMRRGKEIAQGSHAAMQFLISRLRNSVQEGPAATLVLEPAERSWILQGMGKVCLQVHSEEELLTLHDKAQSAGIKSFLIRDSGRTEFGGIPTYTACAIGPDEEHRIDAVTGDLVPY